MLRRCCCLAHLLLPVSQWLVGGPEQIWTPLLLPAAPQEALLRHSGDRLQMFRHRGKLLVVSNMIRAAQWPACVLWSSAVPEAAAVSVASKCFY